VCDDPPAGLLPRDDRLSGCQAGPLCEKSENGEIAGRGGLPILYGHHPFEICTAKSLTVSGIEARCVSFSANIKPSELPDPHAADDDGAWGLSG
jgi:hypothetical protein